MRSARSFALTTTSSSSVVRAFEAAAGKIGSPAAALIFLTGSLAEDLPNVTSRLAAAASGVPLLVGVGAGVMNEDHEIEGQAGAAGLVWQGGSASAVALDPKTGDLGQALDEAMRECRASTAFILLRPDRFEPGLFTTLALRGRQAFGGGTASTEDVYAVDKSGRVSHGPLATLLWSDLVPLVGTTRASRLITPLSPVTRVSKTMLLEIAGESALDVLSAAGRDLAGQPLIFMALAAADADTSTPNRTPQLLLRPIQGVDPARRGVILGEPVEPGCLAAFAVRDAGAARSDLQAMTRELARDSAGAAPRFAIYVNCAGRGTSLYSAANVDSRLLRSRLGDIPIVGLQSAFEFAPHGDSLALNLYTGVLALFTAPS